MGFLDNIKSGLENAKANIEQSAEIRNISMIEPYLLPGEQVVFSAYAKEDFVCLTESRIVFVNSRIMSSKKGITSIPYNKITGVSLEKGGLSISKNVIIWVGSKEVEIDTWSGDSALKIFRLIIEKTL